MGRGTHFTRSLAHRYWLGELTHGFWLDGSDLRSSRETAMTALTALDGGKEAEGRGLKWGRAFPKQTLGRFQGRLGGQWRLRLLPSE